MRKTKLILIEGIPGSGKSSTAQYIMRCLAQAGTSCRWFYEEDLHHPVYIFDDEASMRSVIADLATGQFPKTINAAIARWRQFSIDVQSSDNVTVIDSCLFGYLSWSLFPNGATREEILHYIMRVEQILQPCNPVLLYFYQRDVETALAKIIQRRGPGTESHFISAATASIYGKSRGLSGFAGTVSYWNTYRSMTDAAFEGSTMTKIAIDNSDGEWGDYYRRIVNFLRLAPLQEPQLSLEFIDRYVGTYRELTEEDPIVLNIDADGGLLHVSGHPLIWPNTPLLPCTESSFYVASLPFTLEFQMDVTNGTEGFVLAGPDQMAGSISASFVRLS
ncbi:hypothetical protein [Alicyclobacillus fodiniaquatilis]|uniref:Thymidylate kinase n=1 Tax=Alicyclobacillus fodiniaquatilis TaxID=1661150 RepID=A0ABW4JM00_9BACL